LNLNHLMVDFLTASAHKFNGSKGIGFLYRRKDLNISPMLYGGEQEFGLRAGTENIAGIISAGFALEENLYEMVSTTKRLKSMIALTLEGVRSKIPNVRVNGDLENCLPGILNLGFNGISGESLMHLLDLKGICVSTGSACASGTVHPSHVLMALGQTEQQAKSAIRISYGRFNSEKDVEDIVSAICDIHQKILQYQ
ncbi:MAG: aminotransferase class V-fold PLP-dependent enzyme, partial [Sphaerochaetaceae bacterium]|nr:aminotransferase class V-fold PLP-dependent enzyme [Sphaerochaetaceae bacterium]